MNQGGFEFSVNTGDPATDQQHVAHYRQQYEAAGMTMQAAPMPGGGFHVKVAPAGQSAAAPQPYGQASPAQSAGGYAQPGYSPPSGQAAPAGYGQSGYGQAPPVQAQPGYGPPPGAQDHGHVPGGGGGFGQAPGGYGQAPGGYGQAPGGGYDAAPQGGSSFGGGGFGTPALAGAGAMAYAGAEQQPQGGGMQIAGVEVPPLERQRVKYLRKVYSLLAGACLVAIAAGFITLNVGGTINISGVEVPLIAGLLLENQALWGVMFIILFAATVVAGWVSKIKYVNTVALFGVAAIMGLEIAPMVFVAQFLGDAGAAMSGNPVRDAGIMTLAVFGGITGYVFVTRKDFSYLGAALSMGFVVVFAGCLLAFVFDSEIFSLAVASAGALLAAGFMLYITSYIFRNSEMDDPVGDALALLVQLRNLFMFLLRIFMSRN